MRDKKKIVLITDFFPYSKVSEAFLETELLFWAEQKNMQLVIMPMHKDNFEREIPDSIQIDNSFLEFLSIYEKKLETRKYKLLYSLFALKRGFFWKELTKQVIKKPYLLKELLLSIRRYEIYIKFLNKYIQENRVDLFYTYWFTEVTYSLQSLKKFNNFKLITRVHGFDLYEDRTFKNYMPLRRSFLQNIDSIFTITSSAIDYLVKHYGFDQSVIELSPLGVIDRGIITPPTSSKILNIVSCATILPVKRVDKIIEILVELSKELKDISINWTHIGGGLIEEEIHKLASNKLNNLPNISYKFLGNLTNFEVYEFYRQNKIDFFINTSESEGVPVSIMEAMSCHIPTVAPDIGGISDMVKNRFNGFLLSMDFSIKEAVSLLKNIEFFKSEKTRCNSYISFKNNYDANINYNSFINKLYLYTGRREC